MTIAAAITSAIVGSQPLSSPRPSRPAWVAFAAVLAAVWSALMSASTSAPTPITMATNTNAIATGAKSLRVIAPFVPFMLCFFSLDLSVGRS
jgi:hypothetical protein